MSDKSLSRCEKFLAKNAYIIFALLFILGTIYFILTIRYNSIWSDEAFSIRMAKYTYKEIISFSSNDVHPPLYYCMLKAYCSVFGYSIYAIRFFSLLPSLLVLLLGCTIYKQFFGRKAAFYLIGLVIFMPAMLYAVSEIRMYSWTMFWVFCSALSAYALYNKSNLQNITIYILTSLCAAYSHNYGLISIFYIYCSLLFFTCLNSKNRIIKILLIGFAIAIFYLPWLIQLLMQMGSVSSSYWIPPITFERIIGLIHYPYDIGYDHVSTPSFVGIIKKIFYVFLILYVILFVKAQFSKNRKILATANTALILYILPILTAILVSILLKPVIVPRYLSCFLVLFLVSTSLYLSLLDISRWFNKTLILLFGFILLVISVTNFYMKQRVITEISYIQETFVQNIQNHINNETAFLYREGSFPHGVYTILFPQSKHYAYVDSIYRQDPVHLSYLKAINYTPISSIHEVDSIYTQIFCPENYDGVDQNIMYDKTDSLDIVKDFVIKDKIIVGLYKHPLYRLQRRDHPIRRNE